MLKNYTREERSWMFYDWANSAFSAIVAAIILPVFFKTVAGKRIPCIYYREKYVG